MNGIPVTRYRCPKCGEEDLHCEISIVVNVNQDGELFPELVDFDLGEIQGDETMLCDNESCQYTAQASEFLVEEANTDD